VKRSALCYLFLVVVPVAAVASNWIQVPGLYNNAADLGFVDLDSVRVDTYPKGPYAVDPPKNYLVAWIATKDQTANLTQELETVFDCKGRVGVVQQVIANDSPNSPYHSFDNDGLWVSTGAHTSTIVPDSLFDKAQSIVCKKR
jgi:hypothetical protein